MIRRPRPIAVVCVASILAAVAAAPRSSAEPSTSPRQVEHTLTIVHPGDAAAKPLQHILVQMLDANGEPTAYAMWVDSVICRDKACDVVKVRLHWDALGRYQRYEVAPGSQLTKLDHVPFTKADLAKLHDILADPDSPLKEVEKDSMTGKKAARPEGVDAVSSPTILTLKTAVIAACTTGDEHLIKPTLDYLEQVAPSAESRDTAILAIFAGTGSKKRLLILDALMKSLRKPTPAFCDRLAVHLPDLESYFEVHLFLNLMDQHNPASAKVLQQASALLDHDQFLVSRRAYRHLMTHPLPPDLQRRAYAYTTKHEDQL